MARSKPTTIVYCDGDHWWVQMWDGDRLVVELPLEEAIRRLKLNERRADGCSATEGAASPS